MRTPAFRQVQEMPWAKEPTCCGIWFMLGPDAKPNFQQAAGGPPLSDLSPWNSQRERGANKGTEAPWGLSLSNELLLPSTHQFVIFLGDLTYWCIHIMRGLFSMLILMWEVLGQSPRVHISKQALR